MLPGPFVEGAPGQFETLGERSAIVRDYVDHFGAQVWHAASVPNVLIGVLAVGLAVLLRWFMRKSASRSQQAKAPSTGEDNSAHNASSEAVANPSEANPHPESLARASAVANACGTIETVTPMPASISDPASGGPSEPDGESARLDAALADAVETARSAAEEEARPGTDPIGSPVLTVGSDGEAVGAHVGFDAEDAHAATHYFESNYPGYAGWRWAVTVASAGEGQPVTVSEVVLLPGPEALVAPQWVPWQERVQQGDLGAGDLLPSDPDDPRLSPGYLESDDPAIEEVALEAGLGRKRVLSREGRLDAAERWHDGEFGPDTEMARLAPGACGTCGFFVPLAGSMRAAFGVCGNELAPADGRVVHVEFGCGAHSEAEVDTSSTVPVAEVVYDDTTLDYEPREQG